MIICSKCGFESIDFRIFKAAIHPSPRGLVMSSELTEKERTYFRLQNNFLSFICPSCHTVFTTKPQDSTSILLGKETRNDQKED